jgi:RNA polymerase sigma factor (sigma-70 family)
LATEQQIEPCVLTALPEVLQEGYQDEDGRRYTWRQFWDSLGSEDRDDALQEMRVAAWNGLQTHDPAIKDNSPLTRGIATAKTRLRNWLRGERRRRVRDAAVYEQACEEFDPEAVVEEEPRYAPPDGLAQLAAGAARHLPPKMAAVIQLRYGLNGSPAMTHSEVAAELGMAPSWAWDLERKALDRLRAELQVDKILSERESD